MWIAVSYWDWYENSCKQDAHKKTKTKTKEISELNDQMLYELCEVFGESNSSKVPTAIQKDYQKNERDTMPKRSCESKIKYKNKKLCTFQKCNDNGLDESFSLNNPDDESETDVEGQEKWTRWWTFYFRL